MDKQEFIKKINQLPSILGWQGHGAKVMVAKDSVLELVRRLDEPQKVVIPPLIAGYLVHCQSYGMTLVRALTDIESSCEDHVAMNVQGWLSRQENQETFARAWLDGYELEQEKFYTVEIPDPHHDGITVLEKVGDDVIISQMDDYLAKWQEEPEYQLTEAEIRKDFNWAWQAGFAKEVADED